MNQFLGLSLSWQVGPLSHVKLSVRTVREGPLEFHDAENRCSIIEANHISLHRIPRRPPATLALGSRSTVGISLLFTIP